MSHEFDNSGFWQAIDAQRARMQQVRFNPRFQSCGYDHGQPTAQDRWKLKPPEQNERLAPYLDVCRPLGD